MKVVFYLLLLVLLFPTSQSLAQSDQKKVIDFNTLDSWQQLIDVQPGMHSLISNDGKYLLYRYESRTGGENNVLQSVSGCDRYELGAIENPEFTDDGKFIVFSRGGKLYKGSLGEYHESFLDSVGRFEISGDLDNQYIVYRRGGNIGTLVLRNISTERIIEFDSIASYIVGHLGKVLILNDFKDNVLRFEIPTQILDTIKRGFRINNCVVSKDDKNIIIVGQGIGNHELLHVKHSSNRVTVLANSGHPMFMGFKFCSEGLKLSDNGENCYFTITSDPQFSDPTKDVFFSVKSGDDYENRIIRSENRTVCINIATQEKNYVESDNIRILTGFQNSGNRYVLTISKRPDQPFWADDSISLFLFDAKDGSRKQIYQSSSRRVWFPHLSPNEKFVIWYDREQGQYFTFETQTGAIRNITKSIGLPMYFNKDTNLDRYNQPPFGISAWGMEDDYLIVYDEFDIWKVDPKAKIRAVNLTHALGRRNSIRYRLADVENSLTDKIIKNDTLLITSFNSGNKENGFSKISVSGKFDLINLYAGPFLFSLRGGSEVFAQELPENKIVKALDNHVYLVKRMNEKESPNLFITTDFWTFKQVSFIHPEKEFKWMSAELFTWTSRAEKLHGILYKPEGFDPRKKYPIIIHCYEKKSDELHFFKQPALSAGNFNIPWYVSRGYVVFVPDISYNKTEPGLSALESIVSAVHRLKMYPWVDLSKLALQGHSFGGYETNFIVTHCNLFAAAQASAAISNLFNLHVISPQNDLRLLWQVEKGQWNLHDIPSDQPEVYIKNSPLFAARNLNTPLLLMHNKGDGNIPFEQSSNFYLILKRLNKPVWLLNYMDEDHVIYKSKTNLIDFTIKQQQFFDYYLKGETRPEWLK